MIVQVLSAERCKEILDLPVVEIEELSNNYGGYASSFMLANNLDMQIDKDKIIEDYISSKQSSFGYEIEKIKLVSGRKKSNLELRLKDLKTEIEELKKKLNNKLTDRLEELQLTKQLKVLENGLRKQENDLFFDMAQIGVDCENAIKDLTAKTRFRATPNCYFKLNFATKK